MKRLVIAAAVAASFCTFALPSTSFAATPGTECVTEEYDWVGQASLAAGESFTTGVVVPDQIGTQLVVNSFDVSTDPVSNAVSLSVAGTAAGSGVALSAGEISGTNNGADPLTVTAVALLIDRCHEVAQAAPIDPMPTDPAPTDPAPADPSLANPAVISLVPTTALTPSLAPTSTPNLDLVLPTTGSTSTGLVIGAFAATALGAAMLLGSRRRRIVA